MMKTATLFVVVMVSMFLLCSSSLANLIVNGAFDEIVPSSGYGGGWTASHIDSAGGWRSTGGNPGAMYILNDAGDVASDPTLEQVVTGLTAGELYSLSGDYCSMHLNSRPVDGISFAVDVDGVTLFTGQTTLSDQWASFDVDFAAADSSVVVRLRAEINGTDNDFKVDNISLVLVPEPATMALLALGGWALIRRRSAG